MLLGPLGCYERKLTDVTCLQRIDASIAEQIQVLYKVEFADTEKFACPQSVEDDSAVSMVKNTMLLTNGHYAIALPWRHPETKLLNNRIVSGKCLKNPNNRIIWDSDHISRKQWKKVPDRDAFIYRSEAEAWHKRDFYITYKNPELVPRYTLRDMADYANGAHMYVFSNATKTGHGAVIQALFSLTSVQLYCAFVFAGAVTVPHLELCAVVLVVSIETMVPQEIQMSFESVTYRTDSAVVSHYITDACTRFGFS
ncbi:hypothetical protein PHET_12023 [Paragonimus heterotremus]|uniref:Uncharacterized protein n=1 Tax=Paragonimus heterotremus TaxID=100268 RepID=A0A8J4T0F5_9TREM|nr:hypothetical protein PHET_12023 [Paragonimus heterotremus]